MRRKCRRNGPNLEVGPIPILGTHRRGVPLGCLAKKSSPKCHMKWRMATSNQWKMNATPSAHLTWRYLGVPVLPPHRPTQHPPCLAPNLATLTHPSKMSRRGVCPIDVHQQLPCTPKKVTNLRGILPFFRFLHPRGLVHGALPNCHGAPKRACKG